MKRGCKGNFARTIRVECINLSEAGGYDIINTQSLTGRDGYDAVISCGFLCVSLTGLGNSMVKLGNVPSAPNDSLSLTDVGIVYQT